MVINNEKTDPLNIVKAGSYFNITFKSVEKGYVLNPTGTIVQKDSSNGKSYIKITNDQSYHIDWFSINVAAPKFYERNASVFLPLNDSSNLLNNIPVFDFKISSTTNNSFEIKKLKTKIFYIIIDNKDNPPLKVNSVSTSQQSAHIITYLEKGKEYQLLLENQEAVKPDFDLEQFKDSIPLNIDKLGVGKLKQSVVVIEPQKQNTNNKWWLWTAIAAAILILGFLSWKLLADMKKNNV